MARMLRAPLPCMVLMVGARSAARASARAVRTARAVAAAPQAVREIAWKAQHRLYGRYRALIRKGKPKTVAVTAIARELCGFIWAVNREITTAGAVARPWGIR